MWLWWFAVPAVLLGLLRFVVFLRVLALLAPDRSHPERMRANAESLAVIVRAFGALAVLRPPANPTPLPVDGVPAVSGTSPGPNDPVPPGP